MPESADPLRTGQELLTEVARRYAAQHGLRPEKIAWVHQWGEEWSLQVLTQEHAVKVAFSAAEIEEFPTGDPGTKSSKSKIRNALASLAM